MKTIEERKIKQVDEPIKTLNEKRIEWATNRVKNIDILPANRDYILRFVEQISAEGITK